jgi:outer membrane murein-binding lipoprotein Lpp
MKTINIFRILACVAAISSVASCYDDASVWDEFEEVRNEMGELASRIEALEKSVAEDVAAFARKEGLEAHARSALVRKMQ